MRKNIFTTLKTLITTARTFLYTGQARAAKPNISLDPLPLPRRGETHAVDDWMFASETDLEAQVKPLATNMDQLSTSLSGLQQTLTRISRPEPAHIAATASQPCAVHHHDPDLFDGEVLPLPPVQDTVIGGEDVFLFDDAPAFDDAGARHAA